MNGASGAGAALPEATAEAAAGDEDEGADADGADEMTAADAVGPLAEALDALELAAALPVAVALVFLLLLQALMTRPLTIASAITT